MTQKADIIHRWYSEIWIQGLHDRIETIYQPEPEQKCLIPGQTAEITEVRELINVLNTLVTGQVIRIVKTVEQGNWVSALVEMNGQRADNNDPVYMRWMTMVRIEDDRIVESYPSPDFLSFFEQLGQLPPDCFELLLGGTVLR